MILEVKSFPKIVDSTGIRRVNQAYPPKKYFGKLLTSNIILVILGEYPDPPIPYPLDLHRGGPMGGPGGLNEGDDLMSLTPKCDMFLEMP